MHLSRRSLRKSGRLARAGLVAATVAMVFAVAGCTPEVTVQGPSTADQTGIAVSGIGTVTVRPDIAVISAGVQTQGATVSAARTAAATAMEKVNAAVRGFGVAEADITTQYFSIQPQYDRTTPNRITGYSVTNQVSIKVRNIDNASQVLDAVAQAAGDAVRVGGISFTVDKPEQHLAKAREDAIAQARSRAETLAKAANVKLAGARAISESTGGIAPLAEKMLAAPSVSGLGGAPTPVNPGEQELQVTVSVVYDIER